MKIQAPLNEKVTLSLSQNKKTEGCMICGKELIYSEAPVDHLSCFICGKAGTSTILCPEGHFVCDGCHGSDAISRLGRFLESSTESDPVALLERAYTIPGVNMHGPEYHAIVPAILIAAVQNKQGTRDMKKIQEAIRRGSSVPGGVCGFNGSCGSGVGIGIAYSVLEGATPMASELRGNANRMTAGALMAIAEHGGPRCCKRESMTAIRFFMENTSYFEGVVPKTYTCSQYQLNKDCIGSRCPFFVFD